VQIVGATAREPPLGFQELKKLRPALELIVIEGASHGGALGAMRFGPSLFAAVRELLSANRSTISQ